MLNLSLYHCKLFSQYIAAVSFSLLVGSLSTCTSILYGRGVPVCGCGIQNVFVRDSAPLLWELLQRILWWLLSLAALLFLIFFAFFSAELLLLHRVLLQCLLGKLRFGLPCHSSRQSVCKAEVEKKPAFPLLVASNALFLNI